MSDDLLTTKISRGFDQLDADGDGRLTEHDHILAGRAVAKSLGHEAGSPQEARIIDAYLTIWRDLHAPQLPAGADAITKEQFLASTGSLADQPDIARAVLGGLAGAFLAIADTGGDGHIDPDEFFAFQRGHFPALTRTTADEAFRHLDRDSDGKLSAEEVTTAIVEYWTSTDPAAPGNWWTGDPDLGAP
ncbi:EF-hand domain-containing protein [Streptomyces cavernicola]|uniref:EF-hand domain-containing protein n=1 Tax=Streptomyces cavernicola TaxID=3043613 RepID=A0ABT6SM37_9ACTN|nr:EF-hand domain-containing protein [Streptomyces sp. B-S-A6]MDI3409035.1 EF-hand domain-containing protein [Streptomyces sp. B-S-A6]